ncbi:hypothetical protein CKO29_04260 [Allochromatium vinosum]|uniref:7TM domain sensor diguanylate cyclase n=2 Tax=Allochromatium vinosum TaxID=1049 RepID=D3RQX5_ALLVD|nr:7TM domain sensor diguanylate cyclase [Allochromatium vinosum DSM 180]MBK1653918.1 hypothetical protein [Allochromatium vinosum]
MKNHVLYKIATVLVLTTLWLSDALSAPLVLEDRPQGQRTEGYLSVLRDPGGRPDFDPIRERPFTPLAGQAGFGLTRDVIWLKLDVHENAGTLKRGDGHAYQYLWPTNLWLADYQHVLIPALHFIALSWWARRFLDTPGQTPWLDLALRAIMLAALGMIALAIAGQYTLGNQLAFWVGTTMTLLVFVATLRVLRRGYRPARLFLLAQFAPLADALVTQPTDAGAVASKLLTSLAAAILTPAGEARIGASIGIALAPRDGHHFARLLQVADQAMYRSKQDGRNRWHYGGDHHGHPVEPPATG